MTTKKKKSNRTAKEEFNRLLGLRSAKKKRHVQVIPKWHKEPRAYSYGKAGNATQGVGGWRQNYYRPHDVILAPQQDVT